MVVWAYAAILAWENGVRENLSGAVVAPFVELMAGIVPDTFFWRS